MSYIAHIVLFIGLVFGSLTDLKSREVPDWLNFSLITLGIGISAIISIFTMSFTPLLQSGAGLILGIIIGYFMFYTGQWGGGDSKLIMGVGALLGLDIFLLGSLEHIPQLIIYIINIILVGALYGLFWALVLAIKNYKKVLQEINKIITTSIMRKIRIVCLIVCVICIALAFALNDFSLRISLLVLAFLLLALFYLWALTKAIETVCMVKTVAVSALTEGDWIVEDVYIKKKRITGPKDLGISKEQIEVLKKSSIKNVVIKEGIPFVPSFFLAYLVTIYANNWLIFFF